MTRIDPPGSGENSIGVRDRAAHWHPHTDPRRHEQTGPIAIARGDGVHVEDLAGRRYIEGMAGLWCASLGFSEKRLIAAAQRQAMELPFYHTANHRSSSPVVELAETLLAMAPRPMGKVLFVTTGSEGIDTMVKMAWAYHRGRGKPGKRKIISRNRAYHGATVMGASLSGIPAMQSTFGLPLPGVIHATCPHHWREGRPGESEAAFTARLAAEIEAIIEREGPDSVAAFIAEPVFAGGGVIVPPAGYFERVQAVLRRHDVLLLADEIVTGFGRTGNWWGSQTVGAVPDILVSAKALSSAYFPIAAVMATETVYQSVAEASAEAGVFAHGFTFSGHPVGAAVALEAIRIYQERDILAHVRRVSAHLFAGLNALRGHPLVAEVRGIGLMAAVELMADPDARTPFPPALRFGRIVEQTALRHGLIVRAIGDAIAFAPPLIITEAEIDQMLARFAAALDEAMAQARTLPA